MKKYKGIITIVVIIILLLPILFTVGCTKQKEDNVIKIGAILPLTGKLAQYGSSQKKGMDLFLEQHPMSKIKIYFKDNGSESKNSITVYYNIKDYCDIFYTLGSTNSLSLLPLIGANKIIVAVAATDLITKNRSQNIFKNFPSSESNMKKLGLFIKENEKTSKKGLILYINDDFGANLKDKIEFVLEGMNIVFKSFDQSSISYKNLAAKIVKENYNFIVILGYGDKLGSLIREIRKYNYSNNIYTTLEIAYEDAKKMLKNDYDNIYFADIEEFDEFFQKEYFRKYNETPNLDAYLGYCFLKVLDKILEGNKVPIEKVKNKLNTYYSEDLKIEDGIFIYKTKIYTFDKLGNKIVVQ